MQNKDIMKNNLPVEQSHKRIGAGNKHYLISGRVGENRSGELRHHNVNS